MAPETATEGVSFDTAKLVAGTPGATVDESRAEAGRTAEEKVASLDKLTESVGAVDANKTLLELWAGSKDEQLAAFDGLLTLFERSLNVDFIKQASLNEVLTGIAHQRAAMSGTSENPERIDDVVVPPGSTNAGDELLPPNIPAGDAIPGTDKRPGVGDGPAYYELEAGDGSDAPNKSATREEWDAYAESKGIDPSGYSSKEELQDAVEKQQGGNA